MKIKAMFLNTMAALGLLLAQNPASATGDCQARREFEFLKKHADSYSYIESKAYSEVRGTDFIVLEAAYNPERTCVFGFHLDSRRAWQSPVADAGF